MIGSGIGTIFYDNNRQIHDVINYYQGMTDTTGQGKCRMDEKGLSLNNEHNTKVT